MRSVEGLGLCTCVRRRGFKREQNGAILGKPKPSWAKKPSVVRDTPSLHREGQRFEPVTAHH